MAQSIHLRITGWCRLDVQKPEAIREVKVTTGQATMATGTLPTRSGREMGTPVHGSELLYVFFFKSVALTIKSEETHNRSPCTNIGFNFRQKN